MQHRIPPIPKVKGLPQPANDAFNDLYQNQASIGGNLDAFSTTLDRISGATAANQQSWVNKQVQQGYTLTANLAVLFLEDVLLRQAAASALIATGIDGTISSSQVSDVEAQILTSGLPTLLLQDLQNLGATPAEIAAITNLFIVQNANDLSGPLSSAIFNAQIASDLQSAAQELSGPNGVCYQVYLVQASLGSKTGDSLYNPSADLNGDGMVNGDDLTIATQNLPSGTDCHVRNL